VIERAVAALARDGGAHAAAVRSIQELSFDHPRPLRWLWRRSATLRKVNGTRRVDEHLGQEEGGAGEGEEGEGARKGRGPGGREGTEHGRTAG
jgi:hypothetical protein